MEDEDEEGCRGNTSRGETRLESISSLCCTLVTGLFVMTFIFQNFLIPSRSMASTLLVGDHVVADRSSVARRRRGRG